MRKFCAVCSGFRFRGALLIGACVWSLACSDMKFLVDDFSPGEAKPLTMESVTLHNYKEDGDTSTTLEFMRIHGKTVEMAHTTGTAQMEMQAPEVYFYDMGEPNAQIYYLRAKSAIIHLSDDRETTPAFQSGDIDFIGDVEFLNRDAMMRVVTDRLRYSSGIRTILTDRMTTRTEAVDNAVALDIMGDGFSYDMENGVFESSEGNQQENLEGPEAEVIRRAIHASILAIPWVSGPDDAPIPIPPLVVAPSPDPTPTDLKEEAI